MIIHLKGLPGKKANEEKPNDIELPSDNEEWPREFEKVKVKYTLPSKKIVFIFQHAKFPLLILTVDGALQIFADKLNDEGKIQKSIQVLARLSFPGKYGQVENFVFDNENDKIYFTTEKISGGIFVASLSDVFNGNDDDENETVKTIAVDRLISGGNRCYVGLAIDVETSTIFTSDPYREKNVISKRGGNRSKIVPKPPFKHQHQPMNLAFSKLSRLLAVCESFGFGSIYLYQVDKQGECKYTQRILTFAFPQQISFPSRICFDHLSNLIVTFIGNNMVKFYRNTDLLNNDELVTPTWSSKPLPYLPTSVMIGHEGEVFFASNEVDEEGTPLAYVKEFENEKEDEPPIP